MEQAARIEGAVFGQACGDALGYPIEFVRGIPKTAAWPEGESVPYTDDTQMTLCVADALSEAGTEFGAFMEALVTKFVAWSGSDENRYAPGLTCMEGCRRLEEGVAWHLSGSRLSKGCGANMRVAPVGLVFASDDERLEAYAFGQAFATHAHPTAPAAAVATAHAVRLLLEGVSPADLRARLLEAAEKHIDRSRYWRDFLRSRIPAEEIEREYVERGWDEVGRAISKAGGDHDAPHLTLGEGWTAESALALATHFLIRADGNYKRCVTDAAEGSGDSDSVAAIAGAFAGVHRGIEAVPGKWAQTVANGERLKEAAAALAKTRRALA